MKYQGCLIAVKDMEKSRQFYEQILHQPVLMDMGAHVTFQGFSLQQGYAQLIGVPEESLKHTPNNFQLYFEVEDLDRVCTRLNDVRSLQWVHKIKEYPWGQRDIRIYDPDGYIVEIAEEMGIVVKRFLAQGMAAEQVAKRTMFPLEYIEQYTE